MADFAYLSSLDGKPKKWMADSIWYELGAKERKLFPFAVADVAREFYTVAHADGVRAEPTVLLEPFEGDVAPAPVQQAAIIDPDTGEEHETLADLIAAVKKRAAAPKEETAAPTEEPVRRGPGRPPKFAGLK